MLINTDVKLHLQYTDIPKEEYETKVITEKLSINADEDINKISIPQIDESQNSFGLGLALLLLLLLLSQNAYIYSAKRKKWGLKSPENLVDLTGGEYSAKMRVNFSEKEYAFVK